MSNGMMIDGYTISVDDRKLVIRRPELDETIDIIFSPLQASQLAVMLNKLVPDDYGVRSDFRIPVTSDMGLETIVTINGTGHKVDTTSLSLSGFYAQTPTPLNTNTGSVCEISFRFEDISVELEAVVTRFLTTGMGAAFTDPEPSDEHSRLVMSVQRKWIATKSG